MWDLDQMIGYKPARTARGRYPKGHVPHNKGKKWSEWLDESQQRKILMSLPHNGRHNIGGWNAKQVVGISIDGKACVFESSKDVERKLGIQSRNVRGCCQGRRNLAGGIFFQWAENWNGSTELTAEQRRKYEIAMKRNASKN